MTHTFNDIANKEHRTWNRCSMAFNLLKDHDAKKATTYLAQFSADDRNDIGDMYERITKEGYSTVRAAINRAIVPTVANAGNDFV